MTRNTAAQLLAIFLQQLIEQYSLNGDKTRIQLKDGDDVIKYVTLNDALKAFTENK